MEGPNARDQIVFCALNSFLVEVQTKLACFRLSDGGEDAKVKGTRKVGGAGRVGFHPFFFSHVRAFSIQRTRLSQSLEQEKRSCLRTCRICVIASR